MNKLSHLRAIGLAVIGFTLWVVGDSLIKLSGQSVLPPYEMVAVIGLAGVLPLFIRNIFRRKVKSLWPKQPRKQPMRAGLELGNVFFIVIALRHLSLTMFYIVVFTAPMVITLLATLTLQERLGVHKSLAVLAGFAGVVIAINPLGHSTQGDWAGYAACAVCVTCFSSNIVWLRRMTQTETTESMVFFSNATKAILCGSLLLWHAEPITFPVLFCLAAVGVFGVIGDLCTFLALKYTAAANVSQYHYTQLITGALIGYLVWHEVPSVSMLIGAAIIVAAGFYIAGHARKADNLAAIGTR